MKTKVLPLTAIAAAEWKPTDTFVTLVIAAIMDDKEGC